MLDTEERKYYDSWLDSGIAISYKNWRGLKGAVKTSMHWATPKTERMIKTTSSGGSCPIFSLNTPFQNTEDLREKTQFDTEQNASSLDLQTSINTTSKTEDEVDLDSNLIFENKSNSEKEDTIEDNEMGDDDQADDGVSYDPTPYDKLGLRIGSPPQIWKKEHSNENKLESSQIESIQEKETKSR